jgi:hypothetical protein
VVIFFVLSWKSVVPGGFMKKTLIFLAVVLTFNLQLLTFNCFSEVKGLVGYWSFDEGKGTIAKDSAGKSDGELQGDPEWVEGKKGKALYFDGAEQTVIVQNSDSLSSADITVMMWIKADELRIRDLRTNRVPRIPGGYLWTAMPGTSSLTRALTSSILQARQKPRRESGATSRARLSPRPRK